MQIGYVLAAALMLLVVGGLMDLAVNLRPTLAEGIAGRVTLEISVWSKVTAIVAGGSCLVVMLFAAIVPLELTKDMQGAFAAMLALGLLIRSTSVPVAVR